MYDNLNLNDELNCYIERGTQIEKIMDEDAVAEAIDTPSVDYARICMEMIKLLNVAIPELMRLRAENASLRAQIPKPEIDVSTITAMVQAAVSEKIAPILRAYGQ